MIILETRYIRNGFDTVSDKLDEDYKLDCAHGCGSVLSESIVFLLYSLLLIFMFFSP